CFFFFFQAEDGIRDRNVTGVQTCALPIYGECDRARTSRTRRDGAARTSSTSTRCSTARHWTARSIKTGRKKLVSWLIGKLVIEKIGRASCRERVEREEGGG